MSDEPVADPELDGDDVPDEPDNDDAEGEKPTG